MCWHAYLALCHPGQDKGIPGGDLQVLTPHGEGLASIAYAFQRLLELCYNTLLGTLHDGYDLVVIEICVAWWALIPTFNSAPVLR